MKSNSKKDLYMECLDSLEVIFTKSESEESALLENNLYYVLLESNLEQPDVESLRKQTSDLASVIKKIVSSQHISKLPSADAWFKQQLANLDIVNKFIIKLDLNQPKKGLVSFLKKSFGKEITPKRGLAAVGMIDSISAGAVSSLANSLKLLKRNLDSQSNIKVGLSGKPLKDISPDTGVTLGDIQKGIEKSFDAARNDAVATKSKKIAKQLSSFAASLPGTVLSDFPEENVKNEILSLNLDEFDDLVSSLSGISNPDIPETSLKDIITAEEEKGYTIPKDKVGKAAEAWLKKLKSDGADENIIKLGKVWITSVSNDSDFKKLLGLEESNYINSFNLLLEQLKWPEIISVFKKNAPGPLKNISDSELEPLISPFAAALLDQGIEIQDASGKPINIKDESNKDLVDDVEEKAQVEPEDKEQESSDQKNIPTKEKIVQMANNLSSFLKDPEIAIQKMLSAFDIELKESKSFSLSHILSEKSVKYEDLIAVLKDHLPEDPINQFDSLTAIRDSLKQNLGDNHDITDFPKREELDLNVELDIEDPIQLSDEEENKQDQVSNKLSGALGKTPIDKNKLANILKSYPDITGTGSKATKARRNLRKAINTAAGMEVFQENQDYIVKENKYLISELKDYDPITRWKKLAGIKDD
jgi:hypothetical protein